MFVISAVAIGLVVLAVLFATLSRATLLPIVYLIPVLALAAPALFALHQYVYRSPHIWGAA